MSQNTVCPGWAVLFPPSTGDEGSSCDGASQYPVEELYQMLTSESGPGQYIETALVKSIRYGQVKDSGHQTFILVEVEDTKTWLRNYIVLYREGDTPVKFFPQSWTLSSSFPRRPDYFRISHNGVEKELLNNSCLPPCHYLQEIEFISADPLYFYELVTLADIVSHKGRGSGINHYFCGVIWECIGSLRPKARYNDHLSRGWWKRSILPCVPEVQEDKDEMSRIFEQEILVVKERVLSGEQAPTGLPSNTLPRFINNLIPSFNSIMPSIHLSNRGHRTFTFEQMHQILTSSYDAEIPVERTVVKSIRYGKQTSSALHEFILVEVEDTQVGLTNYAVLDRNNNDNPPESEADENNPRAPSYYSRGSQGAALDSFRVSTQGTQSDLLKQCQLLPFEFLEEVVFSPAEPLYLYQLVALARVISQRSPEYSVTAENCYWFAGLIWECVRILCPKGRYQDYFSCKRGKFSIMNLSPQEEERDEICEVFRRDVRSVEERLSLGKRWQEWRVPSGMGGEWDSMILDESSGPGVLTEGTSPPS